MPNNERFRVIRKNGSEVTEADLRGTPGRDGDQVILDVLTPGAVETVARDADGALVAVPVASGAALAGATTGQVPRRQGDGSWAPGDAVTKAENEAAAAGYRPVPGLFYTGAGLTGAGSRPAGFLTLHPFQLAKTATFDRIGVYITTAAVAGSLLRFGIYADAAGRPGALILDAGTVSGSTGAVRALATINRTLPPGTYWLACGVQGGVTSPVVDVFMGNAVMQGTAVGGAGTIFRQGAGYALVNLAATGGLPTDLTPVAAAATETTIIVALRAA